MYNKKTGRFDLFDPSSEEQKYDLKVSNSASGGGWFINSLERSLRHFAAYNGLRIQIFKSGWIIKEMSWIIKGSGTKRWCTKIMEQLNEMCRQWLRS